MTVVVVDTYDGVIINQMTYNRPTTLSIRIALSAHALTVVTD